MSQSIDAFAFVFSDPAIPNLTPERARVNVTQSFEITASNAQILSSNTLNQNSDIEGLIYVPDLAQGDPCINASVPYVPSNVTRLANLPSTQYAYIAMAPWTSPACARSYLTAARSVTGFMFYLPDQLTALTPPPPSDPTWDLGDGGKWKSQYKFPVYAIPGAAGQTIMNQSAQYSGNMSQVKNGDLLLKQFNPTDYVRLYITFGSNNDSNLPTLWAFLLIVLGVVLILIGCTSLSMHYIQRRNRRDLHRRIQEGDVDMEALGVKRSQHLTQAQIDTLPLSPYVAHDHKPPLPLLTTATSESAPAEAQSEDIAAAPVQHDHDHSSPQNYNQPTCPICLEDYISGETKVRALPCQHIYHPACIDPFLLDSHAVCPVCKAKVVPPGTASPDVPVPLTAVTNAMVRRERYARRIRQRGERVNRPQADETLSGWGTFSTQFRRPVQRLGYGREGAARRLGFRSAPSTVQRTQNGETAVEMRNIDHANTPPAVTDPGHATSQTAAVDDAVHPQTTNAPQTTAPWSRVQPPLDPDRRREWARRRASALLGRGETTGAGDSAVAMPEDRRPKWRQTLARAFPGFR